MVAAVRCRWWVRQRVASRSGHVLGSVHRDRCLTCPSVPAVSVRRPHRLTCPRQRAFAPGHQTRYPASYTETGQLEDQPLRFRFPAALRPPAFASWASCSRPGVGPSLRSAYHHTHPGVRWTVTGFPRSTRLRHGRVGCPLDPGGDGVPTAVEASSVVVCRLSAASLSSPRHHHPTRGVAVTRHQRGFTCVQPSGLPLPVATGRSGDPWAFPWASHPAIASHARQGGDRPRTQTRSYVFGITPNLQSTNSLNTCDLVSQRFAA